MQSQEWEQHRAGNGMRWGGEKKKEEASTDASCPKGVTRSELGLVSFFPSGIFSTAFLPSSMIFLTPSREGSPSPVNLCFHTEEFGADKECWCLFWFSVLPRRRGVVCRTSEHARSNREGSAPRFPGDACGCKCGNGQTEESVEFRGEV